MFSCILIVIKLIKLIENLINWLRGKEKEKKNKTTFKIAYCL